MDELGTCCLRSRGHIPRSFHIDGPVLIELRPAQMYITGGMDDNLDASARLGNSRGIAHVAGHAFESQSVECSRIARCSGQHTDTFAGGQKLADYIVTHQPCGPRNQVLHRRSNSTARNARLSTIIVAVRKINHHSPARTRMPTLTIKPVETRRERQQFLELPWEINRGDPNWIPPLRQNQMELVGYKRHP